MTYTTPASSRPTPIDFNRCIFRDRCACKIFGDEKQVKTTGNQEPQQPAGNSAKDHLLHIADRTGYHSEATP